MIRAFALIVTLFSILVLSSVLTLASPPQLLASLISPEVTYAFTLSLLTASLATLFATLVAIPSSYAAVMDKRVERWLEPFITLPASLPPVAVGASLLIFFTNNPIGSIINQIFNIVFNIPGLVVAQTTVALPFVYRALKSSMKMIDKDLELMARSYGCSDLCLLRELVLPLSFSGLREGALLAFSRSLGEFGASVTLAGAIRMKTETLPIAIYLNLSSGDIPKVISLIIITMSLSLIIAKVGGELFALKDEGS